MAYYPWLSPKACGKKGDNPLIVAIKGEAEPALYAGEHAEISIVELGGLVKILKAEGISNVVLAGGIRHRPEFRAALRPGNGNLVALYRFLRAFRLGDDGLLRAVIATIESYGFRVLGAHEIVPDILAPAPGTITRKRADQESVANMRAAREAAVMIGSLDIGQAAIASGRARCGAGRRRRHRCDAAACGGVAVEPNASIARVGFW